MQIFSYISTRTFFIKDSYSVSLIYDSCNNISYFLKGVSSNIWAQIVECNDYKKLKFYATKNNINRELDSLLYLLKEKQIIKCDEQFEKSTFDFLSNAISVKSKNFDYFIEKWKKLSASLGLIDTLIMELSYKCNLRCKHCYNHKNIDDFMSFEDAKKTIDQAYEFGIRSVRLTGGECTIHKDFLKICEYIRSKRLELHIYSNGQVLSDDEKFYSKLINLYPSHIQLSIYSMDPDKHDYITGVKGSFKKTINLINRLRNTSICIDIATPVLSYNFDCYKEILKYANSIGATFHDNCIFTNNPENNNLVSKLSYEQIKQFYLDKYGHDSILPRFKKDNYSICEAGYDRLCVTPNLDVTPCVAFDYKLGNLNTTTLMEIYKTKLDEFKKIFIRKNLTDCFNFEYCKYCHYCPDMSILDNTFMKKRPILCENAKAYYNSVVIDKKDC